MTTATTTMDSSQFSPNFPSISICTSTHTPTFDLSLNKPFQISVTLTLRYHCSITFRKRDTQFFKHPLGSPGLEFVNIRTGETQAGMRVQSCYIGSNDSELPSEANRQDWITLHPGQPYALDAGIKPIGGEGRMRTIAEMESGSDEKFATLKWPMVHRLLDGEVYGIKASDKARVERWIEGDLGEILERPTDGRTPTLLDEVIEFDVKRMTKFKVKRSDRDGSLNWP